MFSPIIAECFGSNMFCSLQTIASTFIRRWDMKSRNDSTLCCMAMSKYERAACLAIDSCANGSGF